MPIVISETAEGPLAKQSFDSPTVYFDHWAIRLFSDDRRLQDRFVTTLKRKNGTLLMSNISMHEFQRSEDDRHCARAEAFLNRLLPDVFFTNFDFDALIAQELAQAHNEVRFSPPGDAVTLSHLAKAWTQMGRGTMDGFLKGAHTHRASAIEVINPTLDRFRRALNDAREDPEYVRDARHAVPSAKRIRTMVILGELLRDFNLDSNAQLTENDVIDILHAIIPINCCDYVLLDGAWHERTLRMQRRVQLGPDPLPSARTYSRRRDGIEEFLIDLATMTAAS